MKGRPELLTRKQDDGRVFLTVVSVILILFLAFILVGSWFRQTYVAYRIFGDSMQRTLFEDDWVYGQQGERAERGDIVILDVSDRSSFADDTIIKRLIAVAGDAVKGEGGKVYVRYAGTEEFVALDEPYAVGAYDFEVCELGGGEIFVLGDNRYPSRDCSKPGVGPLREEEIVAVVPEWAIARKASITRWETFRIKVRNFFDGLFD